MASSTFDSFSFNTSRNHYDILQVPQTATSDDIKKAFKQQARLFHPDKSGEHNTKIFQELVHARDTLLNEVKRAEYDDEHEDDNFMTTSGALLCGRLILHTSLRKRLQTLFKMFLQLSVITIQNSYTIDSG